MRTEDGIVGLYDYTHRLVQRRRSDPQDDLVSVLVHVEEEGERLTEDELYAMVVNLIGGAIGSSQSAIANVAYLFLRHLYQATRLRTDPTLYCSAVEECLRYAPPVSFDAAQSPRAGEHRRARTADWRHGVVVTPSRQPRSATLCRSASLRHRTQRRPDVSFGHGPHFCLGRALARANLTEAIPAFVRRCHDLEVVGEPVRVPFDPTEKFAVVAAADRGWHAHDQ